MLTAKGKCRAGRLWAYVRDDKSFAGSAAPAALFYYSADRGAAHPERHLANYSGCMQADAYSGYNGLYVKGRRTNALRCAKNDQSRSSTISKSGSKANDESSRLNIASPKQPTISSSVGPLT